MFGLLCGWKTIASGLLSYRHVSRKRCGLRLVQECHELMNASILVCGQILPKKVVFPQKVICAMTLHVLGNIVVCFVLWRADLNLHIRHEFSWDHPRLSSHHNRGIIKLVTRLIWWIEHLCCGGGHFVSNSFARVRLRSLNFEGFFWIVKI